MSADGWKKMWTDIESNSRLVDQGVQDLIGAKTLESLEIVNDLKMITEKHEAFQLATLDAVKVSFPTLDYIFE